MEHEGGIKKALGSHQGETWAGVWEAMGCICLLSLPKHSYFALFFLYRLAFPAPQAI